MCGSNSKEKKGLFPICGSGSGRRKKIKDLLVLASRSVGQKEKKMVVKKKKLVLATVHQVHIQAKSNSFQDFRNWTFYETFSSKLEDEFFSKKERNDVK